PSLAPQYAVYFIAGLAIGASDMDRGLLGSEGVLARRWAVWLAGAVATFIMWLVPAALITKGYDAAGPGFRLPPQAALLLLCRQRLLRVGCHRPALRRGTAVHSLQHLRQCVWHLSVSLRVCDLDAIRAASLFDARVRERSDRPRRDVRAELGRQRRREPRSARRATAARRPARIDRQGSF